MGSDTVGPVLSSRVQDLDLDRVYAFPNDESRQWEYDWNSGSSQRERARTHVFRAYAFAPVGVAPGATTHRSDYLDADAASNTNTGGQRQQINVTARGSDETLVGDDDEVWQIVGVVTSPPFTVSAYRKPVEAELPPEPSTVSLPVQDLLQAQARASELQAWSLSQVQSRLPASFGLKCSHTGTRTQEIMSPDRGRSTSNSAIDISSDSDPDGLDDLDGSDDLDDLENDRESTGDAPLLGTLSSTELNRLLWQRQDPVLATASTNLALLALFVSQIRLTWLAPMSLTTQHLLPLLRRWRDPLPSVSASHSLSASASAAFDRDDAEPRRETHVSPATLLLHSDNDVGDSSRERLLMHFVNHCAPRIVSGLTPSSAFVVKLTDRRPSWRGERVPQTTTDSRGDRQRGDSDATSGGDASTSAPLLEELAEQSFGLVCSLLEPHHWKHIEQIVMREARRVVRSDLSPTTTRSRRVQGRDKDARGAANQTTTRRREGGERGRADEESYSQCIDAVVGLLDGALAASGASTLGLLVDNIVSSVYADSRNNALEDVTPSWFHPSVLERVKELLRNTSVLGDERFRAQVAVAARWETERTASWRESVERAFTGRWVCRTVESASVRSGGREAVVGVARSTITQDDASAVGVLLVLLHAFGFDLELAETTSECTNNGDSSDGSNNDDSDSADGSDDDDSGGDRDATSSSRAARPTVATTTRTTAPIPILTLHSLASLFPQIGARFVLDGKLHTLDRLPVGLSTAWLLATNDAAASGVQYRGRVIPAAPSRVDRGDSSSTIQLDVFRFVGDRDNIDAVRLCFELTHQQHLPRPRHTRDPRWPHPSEQRQYHQGMFGLREWKAGTPLAARARLQVRVSLSSVASGTNDRSVGVAQQRSRSRRRRSEQEMPTWGPEHACFTASYDRYSTTATSLAEARGTAPTGTTGTTTTADVFVASSETAERDSNLSAIV